jgi:glyoxylase-like metal-dependent hydrolase (beta-lactamase superfamily II)
MKVPEEFLENFRITARRALEAYSDRTEAFAADSEIIPGIRAIAMPGHTPGHTAYRINSGDEELLHVGDLFFDEAFDLAHPDWRTAFDADGPLAARTRREFLASAANARTALFAFHMPFPALGRVRTQDSGFGWMPAHWDFDAGRPVAPTP